MNRAFRQGFLLLAILPLAMLLFGFISSWQKLAVEDGLILFSAAFDARSLSSDDIESFSSREASLYLQPSILPMLSERSIRLLAVQLTEKALKSGKAPRQAVASILPEPAKIIAMLARTRDIDDFEDFTTIEGSAGKYYAAVTSAAPVMKPLRKSYEIIFEAAFAEMKKLGQVRNAIQDYALTAEYRSGITLPGLSSRPLKSQYDLAHTFALDIFLQDVEVNPVNGLQKGPMIFSLSDGLVIAAEKNWRGGETLEEYGSGGISPKAGNGVIIYDPSQRKYFSYFHLHDVLVEPGDAIQKGQPLGYGGNTGTNARKKGHGEHVHVEIFDAVLGKNLRNSEIAAVIFSR